MAMGNAGACRLRAVRGYPPHASLAPEWRASSRTMTSVESCGRRGPVSPGFFFESTSPHKHAIAATHKGLRGLAPLWRGGVRG